MTDALGLQGLAPSQWIERLDPPTAGGLAYLESIYGSGQGVIQERIAHIRHSLHAFQDNFGNVPVRLFRCPGRINLRGMHVDTHGGYLNLMTHQRETIVAASRADGAAVEVVHADPAFGDFTLELSALARPLSDAPEWEAVMTRAAELSHCHAGQGGWRAYVEGCIARVLYECEAHSFKGMRAVVSGDIPHGAGLSASSSLCLAILMAFAGVNGVYLSLDATLASARDAEWYAGARTGLSDPGAMLLAGRDQLARVAFQNGPHPIAEWERTDFPAELNVLVVDSFTRRNLGGSQLLDYTKNRFAYSLALDIFRQELMRAGVPVDAVNSLTRLSQFGQEDLEALEGLGSLFEILNHVPETVSIETVRAEYELPNFDEDYDRYFGSLVAELRPNTLALRGPLVFGLAESERARKFFDAIRHGDWAWAGELMVAGHDGDRYVEFDSASLGDGELPLWSIPGAYGASTPALDAIVDSAMNAGALGASLTGAGLGGAVVVLCEAQESTRIRKALEEYLATPGYQRIAHSLGADMGDAKQAVLHNQPTAAACELNLP